MKWTQFCGSRAYLDQLILTRFRIIRFPPFQLNVCYGSSWKEVPKMPHVDPEANTPGENGPFNSTKFIFSWKIPINPAQCGLVRVEIDPICPQFHKHFSIYWTCFWWQILILTAMKYIYTAGNFRPIFAQCEGRNEPNLHNFTNYRICFW